MGAVDNRQSPQERAELEAAWQAHPAVEDMRENLEAMLWRENAKFDVAGFNKAFAFMAAWQKEHGPLPVSGIMTG